MSDWSRWISLIMTVCNLSLCCVVRLHDSLWGVNSLVPSLSPCEPTIEAFVYKNVYDFFFPFLFTSIPRPLLPFHALSPTERNRNVDDDDNQPTILLQRRFLRRKCEDPGRHEPNLPTPVL